MDEARTFILQSLTRGLGWILLQLTLAQLTTAAINTLASWKDFKNVDCLFSNEKFSMLSSDFPLVVVAAADLSLQE